MAKSVECSYCKEPAKLVDGKTIYPHRHDLRNSKFYQCQPCKAYVGCHNGSNVPFGRLANANLRKHKQAAHAAFDPLWKRKMRLDKLSKKRARCAGYSWLAAKLNISAKDCHIGMFDIETCQRVVDVCSNWKADP